MRRSKLINISFEEEEVKQALIEYMRAHHKHDVGDRDLQHIEKNTCSLDWDDDKLMLSVDGELPDI